MSMSAVNEPRFDERYLAEAFAALDTSDTTPVNRTWPDGDLEAHALSITRLKCLDECENAIADLSANVVEFLTGVFDQITDSFLPAPLWQTPNTPAKTGKQKDNDAVLRSLKIVSAARLALASDKSQKDKQLKGKVERLYQSASRYLDSVPQYESLQDIEALLLLAELEYGRNQSDSSRTRLKNVIVALTESNRMRSALIFGQSMTLVRRRNALRTALMMLHWYFSEVPRPLEDLQVDIELEPGESPSTAEELFVTSQLRLASLHHRLKRFVDAQPFVDERTWLICEKAFSIWYDDLREGSKALDSLTEDAPVNFFVFHQQYLSTRIMLSKSHERLYRRSSGVRSPPAQREVWTCPASAKNDAIKIASSLRNYGQRHRFREAPLSFSNHISAAIDILINAAETATNEDDRNAYLHISSFLSGVLKYMAEVHVRAGTLLEAVQQRMNNVLQKDPIRSNSAAGNHDVSSIYSAANGPDSYLWQWTRYDLTDEFGHAAASPEPERPRSVMGVLQTSRSLKQERPQMVRQTSTPVKLVPHSEVLPMQELQTPTPSYHSTKDAASVLA
ncbi:hypothetical protein LTR70_005094 [Exophiala xenobiotica]|uniref:Uncharacterized protein n=1 Tax=Lithohypha guttulata TaxID=1690604 RepID=A0ABR0KAL4_9EURO|nr:hypothetical protein LTR24_004818 [Lithohypha guttulata]KAK5319193.1 hypothetical protein LTR70_005094 [Exophiala xenobiotica]